MPGRASAHGAHQGRRVAVRDTGQPQRAARLPGQDLGPLPLAARDRYQGSLAQRDRGSLAHADALTDARRLLEGRVRVVEIAGKRAHDPLGKRGRRRGDVLHGEPPDGLVRVGAHLLHPAPAQDGPEHGGPRQAVRIIGPGVAVPPAIGHVGPSFGVGRPPGQRGEDPSLRGEDRALLDRAPVFQPLEPAQDGCDPAVLIGRHPHLRHLPGNLIDVPGCDGVFHRRLRQIVAAAPAGRAAAQLGHQFRLETAQLGQQHVTEQVVVPVPLSLPVQRNQQQIGPRQIGQGRCGPAQLEHRVAERPAHAVQHRGPGQEHPLLPGDPGEELRLDVVRHEPVAAVKGRHGTLVGTALPQAQRREIQSGRPPLGPPVQLRQVIFTQRHAGVAQQRCCLIAAERQIASADLRDPPFGPQPRDLQGRLGPPGQHEPGPAGHMLAQRGHRGPAYGVVQHVHVVQDQDHRRCHRREGPSEPGKNRAGNRADRGGKCLEDPVIDRLYRVERFGNVAEQGLRVVVRRLDRDPREGLTAGLGPLGQQGGLAIAGRRDHRDNRRQVASLQPFDQRGAANRPGPLGRTAERRRAEPEPRHARQAPLRNHAHVHPLRPPPPHGLVKRS